MICFMFKKKLKIDSLLKEQSEAVQIYLSHFSICLSFLITVWAAVSQSLNTGMNPDALVMVPSTTDEVPSWLFKINECLFREEWTADRFPLRFCRCMMVRGENHFFCVNILVVKQISVSRCWRFLAVMKDLQMLLSLPGNAKARLYMRLKDDDSMELVSFWWTQHLIKTARFRAKATGPDLMAAVWGETYDVRTSLLQQMKNSLWHHRGSSVQKLNAFLKTELWWLLRRQTGTAVRHTFFLPSQRHRLNSLTCRSIWCWRNTTVVKMLDWNVHLYMLQIKASSMCLNYIIIACFSTQFSNKSSSTGIEHGERCFFFFFFKTLSLTLTV